MKMNLTLPELEQGYALRPLTEKSLARYQDAMTTDRAYHCDPILLDDGSLCTGVIPTKIETEGKQMRITLIPFCSPVYELHELMGGPLQALYFRWQGKQYEASGKLGVREKSFRESGPGVDPRFAEAAKRAFGKLVQTQAKHPAVQALVQFVKARHEAAAKQEVAE